jgi:BirA family biotin operon repressor/biotin-[acetyl-CoA-carboxylase] ligase
MIDEIPVIRRAVSASTNHDLWELHRAGATGPLALMAGRQTDGRGRLGRSWHSGGEGNLALSVLQRIEAGGEDLPFLPLWAALGAADAVERRTGVAPGVKWPNDITVGGRKVGGILVESRASAAGGFFPVVIGVGLNVNSKADDFPEDLRAAVATLAETVGGALPLMDLARDIVYTLFCPGGLFPPAGEP